MGVGRPRSVAPLQSVRKRGVKKTFLVVCRLFVTRDDVSLCAWILVLDIASGSCYV